MTEPDQGFMVVDASVWVSRLVPQDVFHSAVKKWMEDLRNTGVIFLSPALLLPEVAGAISRPTQSPQLANRAVQHLQNLVSLRLVNMDQSLIREAAQLAADLGLRGADSLYVALSARLNLALATLDADQRTKASSIIPIHLIQNI